MLDIDPDGEAIRTETTVTCRLTGDHTARCPWRALAYVGAETEDAAFACSGIAVFALWVVFCVSTRVAAIRITWSLACASSDQK